MLVIEEELLYKLGKHEKQAERLAHLKDSDLDKGMRQYGEEKASQLLAVYSRRLQVKLGSNPPHLKQEIMHEPVQTNPNNLML
jgi:hypothetical protein